MSVSYIGRTDLPRGIRNNNPGNLETGEGWKGESGADGRFAVFSNMSWGLRALAKDLTSAYNKDGLTTIDEIIPHYAPAFENNDTAYINDVVNWSAIPSNYPLEFPRDLHGLMKGIIMHENGDGGAVISDAEIDEGISLAGSLAASVAAEAAANPGTSVGILLFLALVGFAAFSRK